MKFIFVGGCGRSGTTLVQKVLTAHSAIAGGPEFDFSGEIAALFQKMNHPASLERLSYFYTGDELTESFRKFYSSFFRKIAAAKNNAGFVSEKTPVNINYAQPLLQLFPDAVFVNVIRDGRDVYVSHKEVADRYRASGKAFVEKAFTVYGVSDTWNKALFRYQKLSGSPYASRVFNVMYEQLLTDTENVTRSLCAHVGVPFEDTMIDPAVINSEFDKKMKSDGIWYTNEKLEQGFNLNKIGRWKKELSVDEKVRLQLLMGPNLRAFGYEIEKFPASVVARVKLLNRIRSRF